MRSEEEIRYDDKKTPVAQPSEKRSSRVFRPKLDLKLCDRCRLCIAYCPEGCIELKEDKPVIDYSLCTGCLICLRQCPKAAITEERE